MTAAAVASALPNTFLVGAPKSGTTYLARWLADADDVFVPAVKEPGFFADARQHVRGLGHCAKTYYRDAAGERIRVDATPWYLYPASVPARLADAAGDEARIVVLLREPVARTLSMFHDQVSRCREPRSFARAVEDDLRETDPAGTVAREFGPDLVRRYALCSRYAEPVERYLATFGPARVCVVLAEELWRTPEVVGARLDAFLGVHLPPPPADAANPSSRPRLAGVEKLLARTESSTTALRSLVGRSPRLVNATRSVMEATARWNQVPARYDAPDPDVERRLADWFAPANQRLAALLGHDLEAWKRAG